MSKIYVSKKDIDKYRDIFGTDYSGQEKTQEYMEAVYKWKQFKSCEFLDNKVDYPRCKQHNLICLYPYKCYELDMIVDNNIKKYGEKSNE